MNEYELNDVYGLENEGDDDCEYVDDYQLEFDYD